jgi:diacylglycerol kinase (ATP)
VALPFQLAHRTSALILVNPAAGGGRAGAVLPRMQALVASQGVPAEFLLTKSAEDLEARAREAVAHGRGLLLAMGGDGTLQGLVNATAGADVVLGVLPAGGGNDFAAALGMPEDPLVAVQTILHGETRWVDLIRARTADGRERLYVGGGGLGLDAEAARHAGGEYRKLRGRLRYVAAALRALRGFTAVGLRAEFPDSEHPAIETKVLLAGVSNTPTYGAGLRLVPDANIEDGWLDVALVEDLSFLQVLRLVPRLLLSGDLQTPGMQRMRAKRVRLITERPCAFHGDGEILGPAPVEIEVVPRAVQMLWPRRT